MLEELWKAAAVTTEAMLADRSQGDLIVVSAINTAASAQGPAFWGRGEVSPCCERVDSR